MPNSAIPQFAGVTFPGTNLPTKANFFVPQFPQGAANLVGQYSLANSVAQGSGINFANYSAPPLIGGTPTFGALGALLNPSGYLDTQLPSTAGMTIIAVVKPIITPVINPGPNSQNILSSYLGGSPVTGDTFGFNVGDAGTNGPDLRMIAQMSSGVITGAVGLAGSSAGSGATGTAAVSGGALTGITVGSGGSGYLFPPFVYVTGGGGSGGTAHAVLTAGAVTSYVIDTPGTGYTSPPTVVVSAIPDVTQWASAAGVVNTDGSAQAFFQSNGTLTTGTRSATATRAVQTRTLRSGIDYGGLNTGTLNLLSLSLFNTALTASQVAANLAYLSTTYGPSLGITTL